MDVILSINFTNTTTNILSYFLCHVSKRNVMYCTKKEALLKHASWIGTLISYFWTTTKCLSKLQGSLEITLSTSFGLSKINRSVLSPRFLIWKPVRERYKGLKVHPIASTFRNLLVRNLATIICFWERLSSPIVILSPSPSDGESQVHCLDKSSI